MPALPKRKRAALRRDEAICAALGRRIPIGTAFGRNEALRAAFGRGNGGRQYAFLPLSSHDLRMARGERCDQKTLVCMTRVRQNMMDKGRQPRDAVPTASEKLQSKRQLLGHAMPSRVVYV